VVILRHSTDTGFFRDIGESAVGVLTVEPVPELWIGFVGQLAIRHGIVDFGAIGKEDVQPSVVVVIKKSDTSSHRLDQVLITGCRVLLLKLDFSGFGDVSELHLLHWLPRQFRRCNSLTSPKPLKSSLSRRTLQPVISTWSRRWEEVSLFLITTTTDGWTSSLPMAPKSTIPCLMASCPTNPIHNSGTGSTVRTPTALSPMSRKKPVSVECRKITTTWEWRWGIMTTMDSRTFT